jgi:outer membrane protein
MKIAKFRNILLPAVATFMAFSATAQTERNISLSEAMQLAIKNSGALHIANAQVQEAVAASKQAKDSRLPDLKVSGSYLRLNNPDVTLKVKLGSSSSKGSPISVSEASYAMGNLSIPVFGGFRIKYGIESAQLLEAAAKLDAEQQKEAILENAVEGYELLFKAQKMVDLLRENLKAQEQRVGDFTNLEANGVLALNDLLKAKLQKSNIELALMDAESNLRMTRVNMCLLLGLPEGTALSTDSSVFKFKTEVGTVSDWEQTAFRNRKDMASLMQKEKASEIAIKAAKGEYYPGVAVTGGYIAANVPGLFTVSNAVNAGIGVQYNLASLWKTPAKIEGAKARLIEIQANQGILSDAVRLQINQAYEAYLLAVKKIDVYVLAVDQAEENYRISKNKYDNKLLTLTELIDAEVALLQTRINHTEAKADAYAAYKKLQTTAGVLLDEK